MNIDAGNIFSIIQGNKTRAVVLGLALLVSIMGYVYVVDFIDPNKNFIDQISRAVFRRNYIFYSGSEGGIYIRIGQLLERKTRQRLGTSFTNKKTSGAFENAINVASRSGACGIIQADTLRKSDPFAQDLNYVTPLYLERMHILYRNRPGKNLDEGKALISNSQEILDFFNGAVLNGGHHRSGTRVFVGYLLSFLEEAESKRFASRTRGGFTVVSRSSNFKKALQDLEDDGGDVQIIFNIVGSPLEDVVQTLEKNKEIRLMGIDPVALQSINRRFDLHLRSMTFEGIYENGENKPTIGSYAYLVCSKDVPNSVILKMLSILNEHKGEISGRKADGAYLLDEYDFLPAFEKKYASYSLDLVRNLFLFIVSVSVTSASAMVFLAWAISVSRQAKYSQEIADVYANNLPENANLEDKDPPFSRPIINDYQDEIISRLIRGTSKLIRITQAVRQDYKKGAVSMDHYNHLLNSIYQMRELFQANLFQRFYEVLKRKPQKGSATAMALSVETLRHYHTAGYITCSHYESLEKLLASDSDSPR